MCLFKIQIALVKLFFQLFFVRRRARIAAGRPELEKEGDETDAVAGHQGEEHALQVGQVQHDLRGGNFFEKKFLNFFVE